MAYRANGGVNSILLFVIFLRTGVTFWHGDMFWVILASAGLFR